MTSFKKPFSVNFALFALLVTLALPVASFAQSRGWARGRNRNSNWESKKCGKFVNCHDARDGRWDGRGPRNARFNNRWDRDNHWSRDNRWRHNRWTHRRYSNDRSRFSQNSSVRYQRNRYSRRY